MSMCVVRPENASMQPHASVLPTPCASGRGPRTASETDFAAAPCRDLTRSPKLVIREIRRRRRSW